MSSEALNRHFTDTFDESRIFKKCLQYSVGAHVLIVLIFTIKAFFIPEDVDYSAAVRVDIVALPDKLDPSKVQLTKEEEKPAAQEKKITKPEVKPVEIKTEPEAINLKKSKNKQQDALDRLKKMSALDKIKQEVETSKKRNEALQKISEVKGNILASGTSLTGLNKLQHDQYVSELDQHIKQNWSKPKWIEKELRARVRLKIDKEGQIISRDLVLSSGDSMYDETVLSTIDSSAPYPKPPEKFVDIAALRGILIGFPD